MGALASQLVDQGLAGGPGQEGSNDVGVGDIGQLIALPGETLDVQAESLSRLLPAVLEIPGIPRACISALEVPHEDLLQVRPVLNPVGQEVFQPCSRRVSQEQREVADDEVVIICTVGSAGEPVILEP